MLALRNRDFRLLWSGHLLSALGDWFLVLAVPVHIYRETGSAVATGLTYAATNVPAAVVGPFAGVLVDRRDRRSTMALADASRVVLLVAMAFGPILVLVVGVVAERAIGQLYDPASAALVPNVVGTGDELASANAAFSASGAVVRLVGAPLGGVLLAVLGLRAVLLLDAASFAVSFVAVLALRWRATPARPNAGSHVRSDLRAGFRHVRRTPLVRWVTIWMTAFLLCNGAVTALLVPFIVDDLGGGSSGVGLVLSSLGAGYLTGATLYSRIARGRSEPTVLVSALSVIGIGFLILFRGWTGRRGTCEWWSSASALR